MNLERERSTYLSLGLVNYSRLVQEPGVVVRTRTTQMMAMIIFFVCSYPFDDDDVANIKETLGRRCLRFSFLFQCTSSSRREMLVLLLFFVLRRGNGRRFRLLLLLSGRWHLCLEQQQQQQLPLHVPRTYPTEQSNERH